MLHGEHGTLLTQAARLLGDMKVATYDVNGVNGSLPLLLRWPSEESAVIVLLQELKAPQDRFPKAATLELGMTPSGMGRKVGTAWRSSAASAASMKHGEDCLEQTELFDPLNKNASEIISRVTR